MSNEILELSDGTLRQRRNFILTSLVLIVIHIGQVKFGGQIKLFGASAIIEDTNFIFPSLIFLQVYFAWRFYQYFHVDKAYVTVKSQFFKTLNDARNPIVSRLIFDNMPEKVNSISSDMSYSKLTKIGKDWYEIEVEYYRPESEEIHKVIVKIPSKPIDKVGVRIFPSFIFRVKIISDYYIPFLLLAISLVLNVA